MMEGKKTILLLGAGTQALAIVRQLSELDYRIIILVAENGNYADASRYIDKKILCVIPVDCVEFLEFIEQVIKEEIVDVVLPMGDLYAEFLSRYKVRLNNQVHFTIPSYSIFLQGYDKNKLMTLCKVKGYPHPQTIDLSSSDVTSNNELKAFPYPAMLKPNCTTGGRGMIIVNSYEELLDRYPSLHEQYGDYHLQRFIKEGGRQVKIQLCVDAKGELVAKSALHKVRWYPVKGGSSCCAVTIEHEQMTNICHQILKDIHWEGFADFDLIEDPDTKELLIMEINPRLPACIGAAVHAGVNWGQIIADQALNHQQINCHYKTGVVFRHLGFDVLWFMKSPHRFNTQPSWFHFWGKDVYYQDMDGWTDIMPFFIGTYHNIKKLFDPSFKKAKSL